MLQSFWQLLSCLFSRTAACQGPAEAKGDDAKDPPVPTSGEQEPKAPGKGLGKGANPLEKRPAILLVVGPAEHFTQVMLHMNPSPLQMKTACSWRGVRLSSL